MQLGIRHRPLILKPHMLMAAADALEGWNPKGEANWFRFELSQDGKTMTCYG